MELPINKIICGDCLEVMKEWPNDCIDLVVTDPPYGLNYASNWPIAGNEKRVIKSDKLQNWHILMDLFLPLLYKKMSSDSEAYIFSGGGGGGSPIVAYFWTKLLLYFRVKNLIIWDKQFVGLGWDWRFQYETIFQVVKGKGCLTNKTPNGGSKRGNILYCKNIIPRKGHHPTEKPVELIKQILNAKRSEFVCDPFMGTGSTCVATKELNRKYIGIEIDRECCKIARRRLKNVD